MIEPVKVLFVCVGNSCRSQMAEAIARHTAAEVIAPSSAGVSPLGYVAAPTHKTLAERGFPSAGLFSKGLHDDSIFQPPDLIINMSGIPGESLFAGRDCEDWPVEDPFGDDMETYRRICDDIEARVADLAARLRSRGSGSR
ncbi:MAG: low molecular weight phosphatase family protein [Candidatus Acidiferrales bacterium]